jgi:response regulator RpfG family c-di-GMP phosphodiesterase
MSDEARILLVDQSRGALLFQETLLRRRESVVSTAMTASEALARAISEQPKLIIFGYDLFDMTGPEFCREVRANEHTRTVSLLLVGERSAPEQVDLCMAAGCNDFVFRPLDRRELDAKIDKLTNIPVRRQLRTITRIEVSLEKNGRFIVGRSLNVSANGMLLEVEKSLSGEGVVRVHFYLPGDPIPLNVEAEVLRAEFAGSTPKYGVRFMTIADPERERIEAFVQRLRSREHL